MSSASSKPGDESLEAVALRAREGDRLALEELVRALQPQVYTLAQRFLWHPEDAEDASQEILVRVITGLGGFRGESGLRTWVYRIACNTLLTLKEKRMEGRAMSFQEFGEDLARGQAEAPLALPAGVEESLLLEEVKIGCTLALLLCLDRPRRLAYILGEILELDHREGAEVLQVTPATFRKRLSRARASVSAHFEAHCGLTNPANSCRCRRRLAAALELGRVDPENLLFAYSLAQARRFPQVLAEIRRLEATRRAAALYRSQPPPEPSPGFVRWLQELLASGSGL